MQKVNEYTVKFEAEEDGYSWGCYENGVLMQKNRRFVATFKTKRGAENFLRRGSAYHLPVDKWTEENTNAN